MRGKLISTITTGAIIGVVASAMIVPNMDRSTKRRVRKTGKMVKNMAEDMYDSVKDYIL
ncbi:YtxH domain-containing protein [Clostridium tagluense]|uniref:YtxH domain-containing protein n=1 Tax=Clostridium tagluense TaxID=360422 RepID=A0A401URC7_9CLOT|nr:MULTISPECIES: YtxH domain-containing protein [Clostridium]MBU3130341.1 YtxH domain-containing protein [Clostridium tagluense]MBW9159093.1 YtxH domain-containing protein [Clostridium tagluense]MBZ9625130.1 YtxH domain-containing protein [Clostridium sp. FP2]MCB2296839.1 YtxH domain-containing protein [Clostridium tagluense]MCB2313909.1 YtxH domain-containing protein [Clostridium tagluense]